MKQKISKEVKLKGKNKLKNNTFVILFTGLACSGKTTISNILKSILSRTYGIQVDKVQGDEYLKKFKIDSFDLKSRKKVAYIISREVTIKKQLGKNLIIDRGNPLSMERELFNHSVSKLIQVYVSTPLLICIWRDIIRSIKNESPVKNFVYLSSFVSRVLSLKIYHLQGVTISYEIPNKPDITIPTLKITPTKAANIIIEELIKRSYIEKSTT